MKSRNRTSRFEDLTVVFACTGGQHRSVMMAEEMRKRLKKAGYHVKALHRDMQQ